MTHYKFFTRAKKEISKNFSATDLIDIFIEALDKNLNANMLMFNARPHFQTVYYLGRHIICDCLHSSNKRPICDEQWRTAENHFTRKQPANLLGHRFGGFDYFCFALCIWFFSLSEK
jgi:CDGSH-type Zn-finger protein